MNSKRPLPTGWRWVRLTEVSRTISKGTTPTTLGHSFTKVGVPFLRAENVVGGPVDLTNARFNISPETHSFLSRSKLQPGDLLITIAGTLGRVGFVPPGAPEINCNQAVAFVRLIPDVADVAYACFACQLVEVAKSLSVSEAGGTIKNLNLEQIGDLEIPLPPLEEQKRIAAILNEQRAVVEKARAAAKARLEAAKALPTAYLRAVFSSPEAQHWPTTPLRDICEGDGQYGTSEKANGTGEGLPVLRMGNLFEGRIRWDDLKFIQLPRDEEAKYRLVIGDLLFNRTNSAELVGKTAVFDGLREAVFASYIIRFRLRRTLAEPLFVAAFINSKFGRAFIERHMARAIGQVNISASTMHRMSIPSPPLPKQQSIAAILNEQLASADRARKAIEEELDTINNLPAALLRRAFSGEL